MSETRIKIKELEMNGETAIRIAECLKTHEPEIWEVLSGELKQALRIHDVVGRSEQLNTDLKNEIFNNDKDWETNDDVEEHFCSV